MTVLYVLCVQACPLQTQSLSEYFQSVVEWVHGGRTHGRVHCRSCCTYFSVLLLWDTHGPSDKAELLAKTRSKLQALLHLHSLSLQSTKHVTSSSSGQPGAWGAEAGAETPAHGAAAVPAGARVPTDSPAGSQGGPGGPAPPGKDRAGGDNGGSRGGDPGTDG